MSKVLKAPKPWTGTITTSEGDIELENGIARQFSKRVAEHLVENIPGWGYAYTNQQPSPSEEVASPEQEVIELPTIESTAKEILAFAGAHGITIPKQVRAKNQMLSVINAHFDRE